MKLKGWINKLSIIILILLIIPLAYNAYSKRKALQRIEGNLQLYNTVLHRKWPRQFMADELFRLTQTKIIYVYSSLDCDKCTVSHLGLLKKLYENAKQAPPSSILIVGSGEFASYRYQDYKKIYRLPFEFIADESEEFSQMYADIELPLFVILDEKNKIIVAWKAEPEKIYHSKLMVERFIH